jgi:hypothetical protein
MDTDIHRQLGANQEAINTLTREVHELRTQVATLATLIAEARGGWSVLLSIGGVGAALGGVAATTVQNIFGK